VPWGSRVSFLIEGGVPDCNRQIKGDAEEAEEIKESFL